MPEESRGPELVDVLVIGAGPAGIATAVEAQEAGLDRVLVLEKGPAHCDTVRTFYKEGKRVEASYFGLEGVCTGKLCLRDGDRESFLAFMDYVISHHGIAVEYGVEVHGVRPASEWREEAPLYEVHAAGERVLRARFVVVAVGKMGKPRKPEYHGRIPARLRTNGSILFDINRRPLGGLEVLVVGGGDSALEYCQMLSASSAVTLSYRRAEFRRPSARNREAIQSLMGAGRIHSRLPSNIERIEDRDGRPEVHFVEERWPPEVFDAVLYGLGGRTPVSFLEATGVEVGPGGLPRVDRATGETACKGLFVVGDLLGKDQGGGSIISGFNSAAACVRAIVSGYLGREPAPPAVGVDHLRFGA